MQTIVITEIELAPEEGNQHYIRMMLGDEYKDYRIYLCLNREDDHNAWSNLRWEDNTCVVTTCPEDLDTYFKGVPIIPFSSLFD